MSASLIDSHCHIPMINMESGTEAIIDEAKNNGIEHMLCASIDLDDYPEILALAEKYDEVSASVGVHPNSKVRDEPEIDQLVKLAQNPNVIAVGETGLDCLHSEGNLDRQRERFRIHIKAAKKSKKPLIVHSREAKNDVMRILEEEDADTVGGVMHCFVDDWETAKKAIDLGFYISFSGIVTFKNATELKEVAKLLPIDKMLIETDAPFLTPMPYKEKQNRPACVRYVAEHIAELRRESYESIACNTSQNFYTLFNNKYE